MTDTARFWDRSAKKYASAPIKDIPAYEYTLDRTRSYLMPTDRVLELGCGTGSTGLLLAGAAAQYHGTDISPEMIRIARDKAAAEAVDNITFTAATAQEGMVAAGPVDVVLALNLLHLLRDVEDLFNRNAGVDAAEHCGIGELSHGCICQQIATTPPMGHLLPEAIVAVDKEPKSLFWGEVRLECLVNGALKGQIRRGFGHGSSDLGVPNLDNLS